MALPAEYRTSTIVDSDGRERRVIHAYAADGAHVADIVFKGRDELPDYSLLHGRGPVVHLGEPPRFLPTDEVTLMTVEEIAPVYEAWTQDGAGTGVAHFVVDASPIGIAELAAALSGDQRWAALADDMRAGQWSPRALKLADALVAATSVEPGSESTIAEVRAMYADHDARQWELAAMCLDRLVRGEVTPEYLALEQDAPKFFTRTESQWSDLEYDPIAPALRSYWSERIATLHAAGALATLPIEVRAAVGAEYALPGNADRALIQVLGVALDRLRSPSTRDNDTMNPDWFADTTPTRWFASTHDPERILDVALALAGDERAVGQVQASLSALASHDELLADLEARDAAISRLNLAVVDRDAAFRTPLTPDDLVVVHATAHAPERTADGAVQLLTRFDSTGYPRASLHFSVNHVVTDHLYGSWNDAGYVVIAPLTSAIDRNGAPASLYGVDTWWERDPGSPIELPGAVVLRLDPTATDLITRTGDEIVVKSAGFTPDDLATLTAAGLLDLDRIDADIADSVARSPEAVGDPARLRTSMIATVARNYAVDQAIASFGVRPTWGGMWETGIDADLKPLSLELGSTFTAHMNTPAHAAEETAAWIHSGADRRVGGSLAEASPAARRVAIAAGVAAPIADRVVRIDPPSTTQLMLG